VNGSLVHEHPQRRAEDVKSRRKNGVEEPGIQAVK
jgi:hypothetical protein